MPEPLTPMTDEGKALAASLRRLLPNMPLTWEGLDARIRLVEQDAAAPPSDPAAPLDVERLTRAIVEFEESKLCGACLSDTCEEHDEMPEACIGCGDAPALAAIYAALATAPEEADRG